MMSEFSASNSFPVSLLPEEIIVEILTRAPAKTIGRCRCVSKPWHRLLSHPNFINAHITRNKQYPFQDWLLIISNHAYSCSLTSAHRMLDKIAASAIKLFSGVNPDSWFEGLPSCHGLVLIRNNAGGKFILNPTTREIRELPVSPYALDPQACFTMYGLGYDHVNDDYKVVTLSYYNTDNEYEPDCTEMFVNVFSIRNGSWKRAQSSPYDHAVGHVTSGIYVNGRLHWLASSTQDYSSAIVGFDLTEEKFNEVPAPSDLGREFVLDRLVVLAGCLCLFTGSDYGTVVWMMKEYGLQESWTNFTLTYPEGADFRLLCMLGQLELVTVKDEETLDERLVTYNLENQVCRAIEVHGIADDFHVAGTFFESLASPFYNR